MRHGKNLAICGANILQARLQGDVEFLGMGPGKVKGARGTQGWMQFQVGEDVHTVPLVSAPVQGIHFVRKADVEEETTAEQQQAALLALK